MDLSALTKKKFIDAILRSYKLKTIYMKSLLFLLLFSIATIAYAQSFDKYESMTLEQLKALDYPESHAEQDEYNYALRVKDEEENIKKQCVFLHTNPKFRFYSNKTWKFGNREWSDVVVSNVCYSKGAASTGNKNVALCRQPLKESEIDYYLSTWDSFEESKGNLFSWCMLQQFKEHICPQGWNLPTELDLTVLLDWLDPSYEWITDGNATRHLWSITYNEKYATALTYSNVYEDGTANRYQVPTHLSSSKKSDFAEIRCVRRITYKPIN
jgi:uncharacterized protein (TIGR02145 family)